MSDMVTVDREHYHDLLERERWLRALESAGIDNTDAYSFAFDILDEWDEEDSKSNA